MLELSFATSEISLVVPLTGSGIFLMPEVRLLCLTEYSVGCVQRHAKDKRKSTGINDEMQVHFAKLVYRKCDD